MSDLAVASSRAAEPEPDIYQRADSSLLVSGGTPIDQTSHRLGMSTRSYQTVAGFALDRLGRIPKAGDTFASVILKLSILMGDGLTN